MLTEVIDAAADRAQLKEEKSTEEVVENVKSLVRKVESHVSESTNTAQSNTSDHIPCTNCTEMTVACV